MKDVMLDLETWGTTSGCALRSIGAVVFDPWSQALGPKFYVNVERQSCLDVGLIIDPETETWWSKQSKIAQDSLLKDQKPLKEALEEFTTWYRKCRGVAVWSQGANFDEPIISAALKSVGMKTPWKFWDSRCTRTAYGIAGFNPFTIKRQGTYHNALDDSIHQVRCVQAAHAKLRGSLPV